MTGDPVTNKALPQNLLRMFENGDLSDVDAPVAPEYIAHQGIGGNSMAGRDGFRRVVSTARNATEDLRVRIEDLVSEGDRVVAPASMAHRGPLIRT